MERALKTKKNSYIEDNQSLSEDDILINLIYTSS